MDPFALYIHIPFCERRCYYCDFNTTAGLQGRIPQYITALINEFKSVARASPNPIHARTIYAGGGTPSLVPLSEWERVFEVIHNEFRLDPDAEITLEANPRTVNLEYLKGLRRLGFNRLSMGMQTANSNELRLLGRSHGPWDVVQSVSWSRAAGFENLNLDLINGLPGQSLQSWQATVEAALALGPDHLSIYGLTIEEGTPFGDWVARGLLQPPDDDVAADQYEWTRERLDAAGFSQYEISNWAGKKKGQRMMCRHNLQYWRLLPYLGFGMAAHGYVGAMRVANTTSIDEYISIMLRGDRSDQPFPISPAAVTAEVLDTETQKQEYLMVSLRLTEEGVSRTTYRQRFNEELEVRFGDQVNRFIHLELLERPASYPDVLRLTRKGVLLGNLVFREFVGE